MKKSMMTLGLAAAVLAAQSMPAQAINREWSAVAGFVGGLLVANAASCNRGYATGTVYQQPAPQVIYQPVQPVVVYEQPVRTGYYEWRTERRYVPGYWVYEDTGCGRRKIWQPGYYKTVRVKTWVDTTGCGEW